MKTTYHFSRQRRQLRHLGKTLLRLRSAGQAVPQELQVRFQRLAHKLNRSLGTPGLRRALGTAAILVSFGAVAHAQTDPVFMAPVSNPFGLMPDEFSYYSTPAFADVDGDGDLDIMVGGYGNEAEIATVNFYENIGTAEEPSFAPLVTNPFNLVPVEVQYLYTFNFVDIDQDGDLDLFSGAYAYDEMNEEGDYLLYYENIGSATAPDYGPQQVNPLGLSSPLITDETIMLPSFGDLDDDGDLDILLQTYTYDDVPNVGFNYLYFENESTNGAAVFGDAQTPPLSASPVFGEDTLVVFSHLADLDNDGDLDYLGSGRSIVYDPISSEYDYSSQFAFVENTGSNEEPSFAPTVFNPFDLPNLADNGFDSYWSTTVDLDADGDLDIMTLAYEFELEKIRFIYIENGVISTSTEVNSSFNLSLTPNPTSGLVQITTTERIARIEVNNVMGQRLRSLNGSQTTLDLSDQPAGMYLVKIVTENNRFQVVRLRKQ